MSNNEGYFSQIKGDAETNAAPMQDDVKHAMTSVSDIYTQASGGNFDFDFNARTGRIESNVILGTVSSGFSAPVTFNYTMSLGISQYYGTADPADQSVKCQFGLNMPMMSPNGAGRIHFASGLVDNLMGVSSRTISDNSASLEAHREQDVKIESVFTSDVEHQGFQVSHINGIVEYYDSQGRIKEMRSESGHGLKFTVARDPWLNTDIITRIEDDESINWVTASVYKDPTSDDSERFMDIQQQIDGVTITTRVVLGATSVGSGTNNNIYIKRISLPNDMSRWVTLSYDPDDADCPAGAIIKKVALPTGQFIRVSLDEDLNFSDTQTFSVGTQVQTGSLAGGVERVSSTVNYSYGGPNNFTGYQAGRAMIAMADNCASLAEDYTYTVTAAHAKSRVITTYNRFHLPVSTTTEEVGSGRETIQRVVTQYSYPIVNGGISAQVANFARWTVMTVDHEEVIVSTGQITSRRNQASRTFDEYGNLLTQSLPSGIIEEYTYYPKNSTEIAGCPPSPDFVRFLHTKTIRPKPGLQVPTGGNQTENYTYSTVVGMPYTNPLDNGNTVITSMTFKKADIINDVTIANYRYTTDISTPLLLGTLLETSSSSNGVENKTSISWAVSNYQGMRIVESTSYIWATGQAQPTFAGHAKFSPLSGLVYEEEDSARSNTLYVYNETRRLTQIKKHSNTQHEEITSYDFRYWSKAFRDDPSTPSEYQNFYTNRVKITSSTGKITCWHYDHEGDPVIISHADSDDFSQVATITVYDRSNGSAEVIQHEAIDYVSTSPTNSTSKQVKAISTYEHRLFGTTRAVNPDGTALNFEVDKAATPFTLTSYADASPDVKNIQKFNDFGDIYETQLTYPEGAITKTVITSSKIYDGYGRVLTATENGTATTFSYDQLNRMTTQTCGEETTAFTYGDRLTTLSELSRIQASYSRNGGAAVTMMDASREFDNFGRIVTQRDPNYDASGMRKVVKRIRYRSPTEQTPYFVETDRGSTWFEHNSITGQLTYFDVTGDAKDKTLEHTAAYDPVSKLISNVSTREIDPNSGLDRNTVSHNYGYDSFGAATSISTMFGVHAVGATTRNSFSRFSTILESMELLDHRNVLICKESSLYDSIGRLTRKEFITGSGLNFFATVTYSTVARGNSSSGKPTEIHITDSNTLQDILRIYFSYDKFGNESDRRTRVMVDGAEHEALTFNQVTMDDGNAKSRTIAYQPPFSPRSSVTTNYEYTPSKKYLLRSTTNEGWRTYSTLYEDTVFSAASGIFTEMPSAALTVDFLRRGDQLGSMDSNADTHEVRDFTYDDNGNVASITISDVNTKQNTYKVMTYNAMNQLLKVSKNGSDIAGYSYDFFGKLVKISDIAKNRTRCLLYGADGLIGEIGGIGDEIARTVYINVGGISIGRYVYKSTNQSPVLELFATTPDGTVHAVYKYVDGRVNRNNAVNFSYSDEGIRKHDVTGDQLDYPIGFKGYFIDSATGCYILGDGFRVYDPIMRQFWSADSISPFGGGGPNRYHYCDMDPINRSDHSGNDWGWEQRLNRPWWKRWGWVIAEALIGAAVGAVTGFLVGGPAGAIAGAIAGGVAAGLGASLKAAAEEVILADSASRTDPTRGDYYIPPAATHLDNFGYGVDLASMFGGSLAGSAAAKPSLASKVGQGSASSAISAGSRAGSMGSKASGLSSAASGGKHAVSGPSRSFPGILAKGSNIRSSLQKNAATGGFKAYPVTFNGQPHTIHLSKVRTNNLRVRRQMMSSYTNGPNKTMHTLSGAHGDLKGHVSAADARFLLEDIDSARIMRRLAARNGAPAPQITHTDIGQGSWQTNKIWAQAQLEQAPGKADEVIYAFCHSGLNSELRAQLGLKRVWAPWRWWGAT